MGIKFLLFLFGWYCDVEWRKRGIIKESGVKWNGILASRRRAPIQTKYSNVPFKFLVCLIRERAPSHCVPEFYYVSFNRFISLHSFTTLHLRIQPALSRLGHSSLKISTPSIRRSLRNFLKILTLHYDRSVTLHSLHSTNFHRSRRPKGH